MRYFLIFSEAVKQVFERERMWAEDIWERRGTKKKVRKKRKKPGKEKKREVVNKVMEPGTAGALVLLCCGVREGLPPAKNVLEALEAGST